MNNYDVIWHTHKCDVIMGGMASQITSLTIVYWTIHSGADQGKHQSSESLAFVREIQRWPVNSPHKGPVTRKVFPFDDVSMAAHGLLPSWHRNIPHIYVYWCQLISSEFHTRRWNPIIEPFSFLYQTVRKHDRFNNGTAVYEYHLSSVTWAPWHNAMICSTDYRMMTSSNGNIFRVTGPLCGEFTGHRWISRTEASGAELWCFLRSASE